MNRLRLLRPVRCAEYGRVRTLMVLLPILIAALSVAWVRAPQAQGGTVLGEVVNGTPGGSVPDDLTVTLHTFSEMEEAGTYTTTVTAERSFRFDQVALNEGDTLVARAVYDGVTYVSEFATVEQTEQEISLPVTVFETTEDPADIAVFQMHLFVNAISDQLQMGVYVVIGNTGSRTYVGSTDGDIRKTWSVTLPDGTRNLEFDGAVLGGRFTPLENGFADTRPIPPGGTGVETSFTYELPLRDGASIEQSFSIPVRAAVLILPESGWALEGGNISFEGTLETQMGRALSYAAGPLSASEPLAFTVVPRPPSTVGMGGEQRSNGLALGIAALVAAAAVITLMWRAPSPGPIPPKVRSQVEKIAALDRDFEVGGLAEERYREKRRSLKQELRHNLSDERR